MTRSFPPPRPLAERLHRESVAYTPADAAAAAAAARAAARMSRGTESRMRLCDYMMTHVDPGLRQTDSIVALLKTTSATSAAAAAAAAAGGAAGNRSNSNAASAVTLEYDYDDDDDDDDADENTRLSKNSALSGIAELEIGTLPASYVPPSRAAPVPAPYTPQGPLLTGADDDESPIALASELTVSGMLQILAKSLSSAADEHSFIACGAAAGFTAAFNAPLAGIVMLQGMARESLSLQLTLRLFFTSLVSVVVSNLVKGDNSLLPDRGFIDVDMPQVPAMNTRELFVVCGLGVATGLMGVFFTQVCRCHRQYQTLSEYIFLNALYHVRFKCLSPESCFFWVQYLT